MEQRRRRFGPPELTFRGRPIFYGWWVVAAGSLLSTLAGGFYIHGFSAFLGPLAEEFDVGVATATLFFAAAAGSEAVLGPDRRLPHRPLRLAERDAGGHSSLRGRVLSP